MPKHLSAQPFNRVVWVIGLLFAGGSLLLGAAAVHQDFNATVQRFRCDALARVDALQHYAAVIFGQAGLTLSAVADDLRRPGARVPEALRDGRRRDSVAAYLVAVLGDQTWVLAGADQPAADAALRARLTAYFTRRPATATPQPGTLTGADRRRWLTLTQAVALADGRTLRIGALIPAARFDDFNRLPADTRGDFDTLIAADGAVLWQRGDGMTTAFLRNAARTEAAEARLQHDAGALLAYQHVARFPLLAVSGFHDGVYLAQWRARRACDVLLFSACALLALITSAGIARRIKTVSDSERYYQQLFNAVADGLLLVRGAHIVAANSQAAALFGAQSPAALLGLSTLALSPPFQPDGSSTQHRIEHYQALTRAGATPMFTWRHQRLDNARPVDCDVQLSLITLNGERHLLAVVRDISQRLRMEEELRQSRQQLLEVQRIAGIGTWSFHPGSGRCEWSDEVFRILGCDRARDEAGEASFLDAVYPPDRALFAAWHQRLLDGRHMSIEFRVLRPGGDLREVGMEAERVDGGDRSDVRLAGAIFDITERKRIERRLMNSERQYRELVELMPEAVLIQRRGRIIYANPAAGALFRQHFTGDLIHRNFFDIISADSRDTVLDQLARAAVREQRPEAFEQQLLQRLDGDCFHAEMAVQPLYFDGSECVQVVLRDIDAHERMQRALALSNWRLQALSAQMIEMLENDRRQLARELHDDVGQLLTFLQIGCGRLQQRLGDTDYGARLATLHTCAGEALGKVRDLSRMLRPAQLDAQGLTAAIEWQLRHYLQGGAIEYRAHLPDLTPRPDGTIEITLFRIFQEALTNVIRHSGASQVSVTLTRGHGRIGLHIVDDGVGFDVAARQQAGAGLGLLSMGERAKLVGGELRVHSVPGVGTELTVSLPDLATPPLPIDTEPTPP